MEPLSSPRAGRRPSTGKGEAAGEARWVGLDFSFLPRWQLDRSPTSNGAVVLRGWVVSGSHDGTASVTTRELADRIAVFARAVFVVAGLNLLRSLVMAVASHGPLGEFFTEPTRVVHLFATGILLAAWRICPRVSLPIATLEAIDALLTLSTCTCWALLTVGVSPRDPIEVTVALAVTYTLIARSVAVPSSTRRTLWISALSVVPGIIVIAQRNMSFIPEASTSQKRGFVMRIALWLIVAAVTRRSTRA